jgi:catechol 2,3-dioxygenase-like lactoylglutathione lyase family enzyme
MAIPGQARPDPTGPVLIEAQPQLFVADIAKSCAFFTNQLGFSLAFIYGDPPFYAQVWRDGARLNLRHVDQPLTDHARAAKESYLAATIALATADHVTRLFADFQAARVEFQQAIMPKPWGATDFVVLDPDGNLLSFTAPSD